MARELWRSRSSCENGGPCETRGWITLVLNPVRIVVRQVKTTLVSDQLQRYQP